MDEGSKRCRDESAQREKWTEKWLDRGLRFFRRYINLPLTNSCIYDDVDVAVCTEKAHVCSWMWVRVKGLLCEMVICLINWTHNIARWWWCHADWVRLMSWVLFIEALDSPSCYFHHSHHSCAYRCSSDIFFQWQVQDSPLHSWLHNAVCFMHRMAALAQREEMPQRLLRH